MVWKWDSGKRGRVSGRSENVKVMGKEIKMWECEWRSEKRVWTGWVAGEWGLRVNEEK